MPTSRKLPLRIGTRGSNLALVQANDMRTRLLAAHPSLRAEDVVVEVIRTTGDRVQHRPLSEIGGKGLFTKEIEEAMYDGRVDLAVHSMKDMPTELPEGLDIVCVLEREDPRDAFISTVADCIADLPQNATVGSSSLRRQAMVLRQRPDLRLRMFRGNADTRLAKVEARQVDATLLATAGLRRLGLIDRATSIIPVDEMLPAVAQGAVGIEIRLDDTDMADMLAPLNHSETEICIRAEREFLAALDGSCKTPIAALARIERDGRLTLRGEVVRPDGSETLAATRSGPVSDAAYMGRDAGDELRRKGGSDFFAVDT